MEANLENNKPSLPTPVAGLGGWLILVQLGLYVSVILLVVQLFQYTLPSLDRDIWNAFTSKNSEFYHVLWGPVIVFEAIVTVVFMILMVYILVCFYARKRTLPKLMILFYSATLILGIVDYVLLLQIPLAREMEDGGALREIARSATTCLIWIPYFLKSVRVKNTFIR